MPIQQLVNVVIYVYVLDKYLSKLPAATKERGAAFIGNHWQVSLPVLRPWFTAIPVGKIPLESRF